MKKIVLIAGSSTGERNRYIAIQQSKVHDREMRFVLAAYYDGILEELDTAYAVDLYVDVDDPANLPTEVLDKITDRVHLAEEDV